MSKLQLRVIRLIEPIRHRTAVLIHDLFVIPLAWFAAYWLRFNLESVPVVFVQQGVKMLPLVIGVQAACFWYFGLYRGVWRFASMPDLVRIAKAIGVGVALITVAIFLVTRMQGIPRSILPIYGLLLLVLVAGPRFVYRWFVDHTLRGRAGKKALIVGAGRSGEMLVRDLLRDPTRDYDPVAFVDDDPRKRGQEIQGVRVIGATKDIPRLASGIDVILLAVPSASAKEMRHIVGICERSRTPFRTLPRLEDLVSGKASVKELRDVNIEDLLGREPVSLEWAAIREAIADRRILVTGGGGSIGSELCRQIARLKPSGLVILESSEFNLYNVEMELRRAFPEVPLATALGDAGDTVFSREVLRRHRPEIVFHAAAYKHVPMLQAQARAAVRNNVLATRTIARLADEFRCKTFVLISTDKAVNPGNVMGTTKHVAEAYCQSLNRESETQFITVRFGNVLGSAGSVIPLFQKQIAQGGPVTVTDPDVTRFFMTIPEATQLILQASSVGQGGEIFVLDMGEAVNIKYLAEQLILLSGKKPGEDIEIVYTGLRPGEKPYEELFHRSEELIATPHPKTLLARSRVVALTTAEREIDAMAQSCEANDEAELRRLLDRFVEMTRGGGERGGGAIAHVATK